MSTGPINGTSGIGSTSFVGGGTSIQFIFAQLQLNQAQMCKTQARAYITKIQDTQAKQKECAEMIEKAREIQSKAKNQKNYWSMGGTLKTYFEKNGLTPPDDDNGYYNSDQWEHIIKSLTNYQETLGTSTQTDMVYLQDFMSQYNSYLQGANKAIQDSNDTLKNIIAR